MTVTLRKKVSVFRVLMVRIFPAFSHIRTEYGEILRRDTSRDTSGDTLERYFGKMRKNADQDNSEYGHFTQCKTKY